MTTEQRIDDIINRRIKAMESSKRVTQLDELEWLQYKRKQTKRELEKSRKKMKAQYKLLTENPPMPQTRWGIFNFMLGRGATILQGLRLGYQLGDAVRLVFNIRNLFKKKNK